MGKTLKKIFLSLFVITLLSGCGKEYKKISYTTYNEYFNQKEKYINIDHSDSYDYETVRFLEYSNGDIQFIYIEFLDDKSADKYIKELYSSSKYKIKETNDYTRIKSNKNGYFKLYRVDNVILYGYSENKKDKKNIDNILKDLGN